LQLGNQVVLELDLFERLVVFCVGLTSLNTVLLFLVLESVNRLLETVGFSLEGLEFELELDLVILESLSEMGLLNLLLLGLNYILIEEVSFTHLVFNVLL